MTHPTITVGHTQVAEILGGADQRDSETAAAVGRLALRNSKDLRIVSLARRVHADGMVDEDNWVQVGDAARPLIEAVKARQEADE